MGTFCVDLCQLLRLAGVSFGHMDWMEGMLDRLALIGVSHRRGGVEALERWQAHFGAWSLAQYVKMGFMEAAVLSTCNRFDTLVVLDEEQGLAAAKKLLTPEGEGRCYAYVGEAAVEQLARIASSLDSLNPGEDQIMMQVRRAYAAAQEAGTCGAALHFAFTAALRIAKKVRREVALAPLHTSLFSLARPELEEHLPQRACVGILGAGEIGRLVARVLSQRADTRLVLCNRSMARAQALVEELEGGCAQGVTLEVVALDAFLETPPQLDALVCAVSVPSLLDEAFLSRLELAVIVDLGLPRNVSPAAVASLGIRVLDVETLQDAGARRREAIEENLLLAQELLVEELESLIKEWIERQLAPSIQRLRAHYLELASQAAGEEGSRVAKRLLRFPIKGLRALAREHGLEAARTFLEAMES